MQHFCLDTNQLWNRTSGMNVLACRVHSFAWVHFQCVSLSDQKKVMFTLILLEKIEKNVKLFLLRSHFTAFHALFKLHI